jgi:thioredoxin reductase
MEKANLPVVVIGAGPVGLAAAAHLIERSKTPLVVEVGAEVGASVARWAHVRMFSPWKYNTDKTAVRMLKAAGWTEPDPETLPTGGELIERYLKPLASLPAINRNVQTKTKVVAVTRSGLSKLKTSNRDEKPFAVQTIDHEGKESLILAQAVIDASGTYEEPNPAGAGGVPAIGERNVASHIFYGIPDVLGTDRRRYQNKRTAVIGSGHSAVNALLDLAALAEAAPATSIVWTVRRADTKTLFGGESKDELPARGLLGSRARSLVESGQVHFVSGFDVAAIIKTSDGIVIASAQETLPPVDEVIVATGFRPNLEILRELHLDLDQTVESPRVLAPLIDPNLHSCGTVYPHGAAELKHPEKDFYIAGMKSYGRAPTFLLMTGYEQIRSIVAAIAGDWTAAGQVELVLPETGVCRTDESGSDCCGGGVPETVIAPVQLGISRKSAQSLN